MKAQQRRRRDRTRTTDDELISASPHADVDPSTAAIVISVASARCRVFWNEREIDCILPPELAARQRSALAVGDRVVLEAGDGGAWRLAGVLPRRTVLSRPDPLNPRVRRLIAANVDIVVNVVSVKAPPLRPRLIDRFLIAIERGGAQPVICVNKIDVLDSARREAELAPLHVYEDLGIPLILCSTKTGEGLDTLRSAIAGKTSALVGHSGVGKSSILNALDARLQITTGDLHRRGTGRHTTTASTLHDLGDATYVIDTPGIREFGLWDLTPETLRESFPEFGEAAERCRFRDCTHLHEPGCEVKERVAGGDLPRARYETYVRLAEDLAQQSR